MVISIHIALVNLSESKAAPLADSDDGSWKPPADKLLVTGMPNIAAPITMNRCDCNDAAPRGDSQSSHSLQLVPSLIRATAQDVAKYRTYMHEQQNKRFDTVEHKAHTEYQTLVRDLVLESEFLG